MNRLESAIIVATEAHKGQVDKAGNPYILHPLAVMLMAHSVFTNLPNRIPRRITLEDLEVAAILHDVVEDTPLTLDYIWQHFGPVVADIVDGVTRRKGLLYSPILGKPYGRPNETYQEFIKRAKSHPGSRIIKLLDLRHNMSRISSLPVSEQSILKRYKKAKRELELSWMPEI